jgi:bifunctional ADP-heptose synthase (sugar kinase/adenylyltransferase)
MVTLSEHGILVAREGECVHIPAVSKDIADVSGAGDTVISVAAALHDRGLKLPNRGNL